MSRLKYVEMSKVDLKKELDILDEKYEVFKIQKLKLVMSRGIPCQQQLDLSMGMFEGEGVNVAFKANEGTDCRNYGGLDGLPEAKELFSKIIEVTPAETIIGGNSSLNMMYDTIARAMTFGVPGGSSPWGKLPKVKFLCPSPGYDRHFSITELFGIEMITIDMLMDGPDMDAVEKYASEDESIKGIWCTPKYSNPEGKTYSDEVVRRFANMKTKTTDFRIFWDHAYVVHHLSDKPDKILNIIDECKKAGNPDRVYIFSSTSKITFPGSGVAIMGSSEANCAHIKKLLVMQTIGPDKMNQLRHVRFLKNMENIETHMKKQAAIIGPKFDIVISKLSKELDSLDIASWNKPNGGYFISLDTMDGCAKAVIGMAGEGGVTLTTPAGATFPYKKDPRDRNIRIAPTFPPESELKKAMELLCICVRRAAAQKLLGII